MRRQGRLGGFVLSSGGGSFKGQPAAWPSDLSPAMAKPKHGPPMDLANTHELGVHHLYCLNIGADKADAD